VTINGLAVEEGNIFRDHHLHLPSGSLKEEAVNTVTMFILNKYRKDGIGLHSFVDKQDE
jgi:hypothetical protein